VFRFRWFSERILRRGSGPGLLANPLTHSGSSVSGFPSGPRSPRSSAKRIVGCLALVAMQACAPVVRYHYQLAPMGTRVVANPADSGAYLQEAQVDGAFVGSRKGLFEVEVRIRNASRQDLDVDPNSFRATLLWRDTAGKAQRSGVGIRSRDQVLREEDLRKAQGEASANPYRQTPLEAQDAVFDAIPPFPVPRTREDRLQDQERRRRMKDEETRRHREAEWDWKHRKDLSALDADMAYDRDRLWMRSTLGAGAVMTKNVLVGINPIGDTLELSVPVGGEIHTLRFRQLKIRMN